MNSSTITQNNAENNGELATYEFLVDQFRINGWTDSTQYIPEIAGNGKGRSFVAYESPQTSVWEAYGQFVTEPGTRYGDFYISSPDSNESRRAGVAMDSDGLIVAVFQTQIGATASVQGRRFSAPDDNLAGSSAGSLFPVYSSGSGASDARVAVNDAKQAVIVWQGSGYVNGQLMVSDGGLVGSAFTVGSSIIPNLYPDVAMDSQGNFVVVWNGQLPGDTQQAIYMSLFDSAGNPLQSDVRISTPGRYAISPRVERNDDGFVVVWEYRDPYDVVARRFDEFGNPIGGEFPLAANVQDQQSVPRLWLLQDGSFFAAWESVGPNDTSYDIRGQLFDSSGSRIGPELKLNSYTAGDQYGPSVGPLGENTLLVAWGGEGSTDSLGVFGRVLERKWYDAGGISNEAGGAVTLHNTIVADNTSLNATPDLNGEFNSNGGNLIGNTGNAALTNEMPSDVVGSSGSPIDPKLGPLADNGGPTKTHLPAADSPAIDGGVAYGAPASRSARRRPPGRWRQQRQAPPSISARSSGTTLRSPAASFRIRMKTASRMSASRAGWLDDVSRPQPERPTQRRRAEGHYRRARRLRLHAA